MGIRIGNDGGRRIGFAPAITLLLAGAVAGAALAQMSGPTEHKGLTVDKLGVIEEEMLRRQTGLEGYFMQLRAITIAPGGQIAEHSHETRPGLVKIIAGETVEGRATGEVAFAEDGAEAIIEDGDTVHWFYNRSDAPATAIVCDLTPVS